MIIEMHTRSARQVASTALAPCPFCGGEGEVVEAVPAGYDDGVRLVQVFVAQCDDCLSQGPGGASPIEAVNRWNGRLKI